MTQTWMGRIGGGEHPLSGPVLSGDGGLGVDDLWKALLVAEDPDLVPPDDVPLVSADLLGEDDESTSPKNEEPGDEEPGEG